MRAMLDLRMNAAKIHGATFGAQGVCAPFGRITPSWQGCLITLGSCRLLQDHSNASPFPIRGLLPADVPCPVRRDPALT